MLGIDAEDRDVVIAEVFVGDIYDILLGKLFHAVNFSDVIIPLCPLDECLSHHGDPCGIEF